MADFLVRRDDLRTTCVDDPRTGRPADGEARLRVERFGFTANNLTYGAFGEQMGYWRFFPAPRRLGPDPRVGLRRGDRIQGARHRAGPAVLRLLPDVLDGDDAPAGRRRRLRGRRRAPRGPSRDLQPLLRGHARGRFRARARRRHRGDAPAVHDRMADRASSWRPRAAGRWRSRARRARPRTATAYALCQLEDAPAVIGLTSARNTDFVRSLGFYDTVLTYDEADQLPRGEDLRYVDMAGDADLRRAVHEHLGDDLRASIVVGATHWDHASLDTGGGRCPGRRPRSSSRPRSPSGWRASSAPGEFLRRIGGGMARLPRAAGGQSWRSRSTAAPRPSSASTARFSRGTRIPARGMC